MAGPGRGHGHEQGGGERGNRPRERRNCAGCCRPRPPPSSTLAPGTGFLPLLLAARGYRVTALDLSSGMLGRLHAKASARGLPVETAEGDAAHPPRGPFDAVVERHLLWTLPDPAATLTAWRHAAPEGQLAVIEGSWGRQAGNRLDNLRARAREATSKIRGMEPSHHAHYSQALRAALPYPSGLTPAEAVGLVQASPWGAARIERLRDVEWAIVSGKSLLDTLLGTYPHREVIAGG